MAGTLYIVATPIGNLDDMPPRVAATFGAADFIAAEDTRVTMKLLNFLGLKKPMVSYYEHALQKGEAILQRIEAGESCALCSDAGMPCVSDPGEVIVRDALARGIKVVPVPAASACVTALAVSGQDTSRWVFEGFLPVNRKQKKERLADLLHEKRTVIFYEAPHKLRTTLDDLTAAFGPERSITLCRELTKLHEEIWKTTLGEAVGKDVKLRIDANQAWNAKQAVRILDQMQEKGLDIEFVEQPVPAADLEGMQYVTRHASVPVLADESVFSPADALRIMQTGAADFVNIKLMKCGGITNALRIASAAEVYGVECMIGCMLEAKISVNAAVELACAKKIITKVDLDGPVLCSEDHILGGAVFDEKNITVSDAPGMGIQGFVPGKVAYLDD